MTGYTGSGLPGECAGNRELTTGYIPQYQRDSRLLGLCQHIRFADCFFVIVGIPPEVEILQLPGSSIVVEPGRLFNLTCISSGAYVGSVEWIRPGNGTRTSTNPIS